MTDPTAVEDAAAADDEEPMANTMYPETGPDREEMVGDYLPEKHEWVAKTYLDREDPRAVAALGQMDNMFRELDPKHQDIIDGVLTDYFKAKTSVYNAEHKSSREEYESIITGMWGKAKEAAASGASLLAMDVEQDD